MKGDTWFDRLDKIHPYPAKYPLKIAKTYIEKYTEEKELVYDPFVGSGTTLLAASMLNRYSYGTDINAIAILLSKFKSTYFSYNDIEQLNNFKEEMERIDFNKYKDKLYNYPNVEHWFCDNARLVLSGTIQLIKDNFEEESPCSIFCKTVISSIINSISNQESDTRYAAIEKKWLTIEYIRSSIIKKFEQIKEIVENTQREKITLDNTNAYYCNSKDTSKINKDKAKLIVTSPPYPNTYDYYLYHKHRMLWLGYDFEESKDNEIGSRNEFSSKKQPASNFSDDLKDILANCNTLLSNNSHIVIIIGDGIIRGDLYDSYEHTVKICESIGWKVEDYCNLDLDNTSRSFNKNFRTKGKKEHTIVFRKD